MPFLKRNIATALMALFVYLWFFFFQSPALNYQDFTPATTNVKVFTQPESGRKPILDIIKNAKHEILATVYILSDKEIINALCLARERGLAVSVLLEQHPYGGGSNSKTKNHLNSCGVSVNWSNPYYALTHEKVLIVDSSIAMILNQNLTAASFKNNREFNLVDTNKKDVLELRAIFLSDWERNSISLTKTHLVVSPVNSRYLLSNMIKNSNKSLDIEVEVISDWQIVNLLVSKSKEVNVRVIVPEIDKIESNLEYVVFLKSSGIEVRTLKNPYPHGKLIISDDKIGYVGSVNLSSQSLDQNREIGILVSEPESIKILNSVFEKDFTISKLF